MRNPFLSFSGNTLPLGLSAAAMVEHEDSFILVGGQANGMSDKIYKYDKDGSQFVEVLTTLIEKMQAPVAMKVKPSIFNSC